MASAAVAMIFLFLPTANFAMQDLSEGKTKQAIIQGTAAVLMPSSRDHASEASKAEVSVEGAQAKRPLVRAESTPGTLVDIQPAVVCTSVDGGESNSYPCKCGVTTNATKECTHWQKCTATDDEDGECFEIKLATNCEGIYSHNWGAVGSVEACQDKCAKDADCNAFAYTEDDCFMKFQCSDESTNHNYTTGIRK
mmetsp:Transcript_51655/g.82061  ORF Transcript_51655/g.82061 Transcript_51655/m.82061 type:complete len:195 (+) Transcript_51655:68-652(+)